MIRIDCTPLFRSPRAQGAGDDLTGSEPIRQAYDCLVKNGYAILDHVLPDPLMADLKRAFEQRYSTYFSDEPSDEKLAIGDRRALLALHMADGFGDPLVYANPAVVALARLALGRDAILESYGAVLSLPGAARQHVHRDGPALFDSAISPLLPAHALTVALPMIEMNELHGTTTLWPGSHRWPKPNETKPSISPVVPVGSCMLWDFRLYHCGTANQSERRRPFVYATYARRWYQDPINFEQGSHERLAFDEDFLGQVPENARSLFAHLPLAA